MHSISTVTQPRKFDVRGRLYAEIRSEVVRMGHGQNKSYKHVTQHHTANLRRLSLPVARVWRFRDRVWPPADD